MCVYWRKSVTAARPLAKWDDQVQFLVAPPYYDFVRYKLIIIDGSL